MVSLARSSTKRQPHHSWPPSSTALQAGAAGTAALSVRVKWISLPASVTSLWTMSSQAGIFGPPLAPAYVASPAGSHSTLVCASETLGRAQQVSTKPARARPDFFSAARRLTDWPRPLVSSSSLSFILFSLSFWFCLLLFLVRPRMTRIFGILFPLRPCPFAPSAVNHCLAFFVSPATALFASPMHASAIPAGP